MLHHFREKLAPRRLYSKRCLQSPNFFEIVEKNRLDIFMDSLRIKKIQDTLGPNWLFVAGGPGLGLEYLESLVEVINLPGSIYLAEFIGKGEGWKQALLQWIGSKNRVHLVAHSFAALFVMTLPELEEHLESLVLMSGTTRRIEHHEKDPVDLKTLFLSRLSEYVISASYERAKAIFEKAPYHAESFCWVRDHFYPHFRPTWIPQKVPTLIMTGSEDRITPLSTFDGTPYSEQDNIALHSIEGASHFPWLEKPEKVNQFLRMITEPVLTTERLVLTRFNTGDLDQVAELLGDSKVMRYSLNGPMNREQTREYFNDRMLAHYAKWGFGPLAVYRKEDAVFLGMTGLFVQQIEGKKLIEVGYRLLPRYWGCGYATESALATRDWGLSHLQAKQLIALIEPSNSASIAVAQRLEMHYDQDTTFHGIKVGVYTTKQGVL